MAVEQRDNLDIIIEQLAKYGGHQKDASGTRMVRCPFHDEQEPSCGIYLDTNGQIPLGFFNCLGCGEKGPWNVLAEKADLEKISEWNSKPTEARDTITKDDEESLLGDSGMSLNALFKRMACPEAQDWPIQMDWRGFPGKLIHAVGGKVIYDKYRDSIAVLFPIKMAGRVRGGVKAIYQKFNKKDLSYIAMPGPWAKKYGLFPFPYVKKLIAARGYRFVVLVEGPRDALRLLWNGIPALAVLGANNVSDLKATFILSLGVDIVYVIPDGDSGGDKLWANLKACLSGKVELKKFKLPDEKVNELQPDGTTKISKMDPGNAPRKVIWRIAKHLYRAHGYQPKVGKIK